MIQNALAKLAFKPQIKTGIFTHNFSTLQHAQTERDFLSKQVQMSRE